MIESPFDGPTDFRRERYHEPEIEASRFDQAGLAAVSDQTESRDFGSIYTFFDILSEPHFPVLGQSEELGVKG